MRLGYGDLSMANAAVVIKLGAFWVSDKCLANMLSPLCSSIDWYFTPATLSHTGSGVNGVGGGLEKGRKERCGYFFITRPVCRGFCPRMGHGLLARPLESVLMAYSFLSHDPT